MDVYEGIAALVLGNGCRFEGGDTLLSDSNTAEGAAVEVVLLLLLLPAECDW